MSQIDLLGVDDRRTTPPPEAIRSRFDVDCTPSPVAAQVVEVLARGWLRPDDTPRVLDLAAGAGSWSRAVRRLLPRARITALEIRDEERTYLEHWADEVVIGDAAEIVERCREPQLGTFDLILGNIPFSLVDPRRPMKKGQPGKSRTRAFEIFVVEMRKHLVDGRRSKLALYVPAAWWQRGADVAALARVHPPHTQMNIPLPISHRGRGQQAATDAYAVYVWGHPGAQTGSSWATFDLPILDAADRKWIEMPGSER